MQIKLKTNPREADPILRRVIEPLAGWIVLLSGMLIACWWPGITEEAATRTITVFTVIAVGVGVGVLICFAVFVARRMWKNKSERNPK